MRKISEQNLDAIQFINQLYSDKIITWPIDYDPCTPSEQELTETLCLWFGGGSWSENGHSFFQFGQDGTGSMFLLWFYPALNTEPPVVFLGSEGERYLVASNITDFIKQLSSGHLFEDGHWFNPELDEQDELDWDKLQNRVETFFGSIDTSPKALRDKAISHHPDFSEWVRSKVGD